MLCYSCRGHAEASPPVWPWHLLSLALLKSRSICGLSVRHDPRKRMVDLEEAMSRYTEAEVHITLRLLFTITTIIQKVIIFVQCPAKSETNSTRRVE